MARNSPRPTVVSIQGVVDRLEDAREALEEMRSSASKSSYFLSPRPLRRRFMEILGALATARYAMDSITKARLRATTEKSVVDEFAAWQSRRRRELDSDPLLVWFDTARDDAVHRAMTPLAFSTFVPAASREMMRPPRSVRGDRFAFSHDGIWWIDDDGLPTERREPAEFLPGRGGYSFQVALDVVPEDWPAELRQLGPVALAERALRHYQEALQEYWNRWWQLTAAGAGISADPRSEGATEH
ncbi:hypothetical protein [Microbacterium oleivorans]|uniref:Uncharacterized protein n=1 Tax=Microbacterium oleivorans TaxID=273677 RepID=A0A7D5EU83_9MICO|nr:hypothetical protein [Microbacterium oleivorans]QLD10872.1 hypothetical protein HW566_03190 [Microbacterium oleivorans]